MKNVTLKNGVIQLVEGVAKVSVVYVSRSSNNIISGNRIADNLNGIWMTNRSTNNLISKNDVTETWYSKH